MALKTGMLVGIVGSTDLGVLIQVREASQTCVIKLNNGTLKKNVPLADVEEARDMSDTKEKKSPIRLEAPSGSGAGSPKPLALPSASLAKSPAKPGSPKPLAPLSSGSSPKSKSNTLKIGDRVKARHWKTGDKWTLAKITRVRSDGSVDVEFDNGKDATRVASVDIQVLEERGSAQAKPSSLSSSSLSPKKSATTKNAAAAFEKGDAIQARYKNGKKLFPGKIAAVNSDGTYDILYDDGDTESRVVETSIERAAASSDSKTSSKTSAKATFRVNQSVRAKYKKGAKWFAGKIKKAHSDGTFDILYEDGDVELRVEREFIESAEEVAGSPKEQLSRTKAPSESKQSILAVGAAVKARYKKGSKLFPGKITKVRTDGTYDILYDDGDAEMRVEREFIEPVNQDDEDESKSTPSGKELAGDFEVGDRVQAYYKGGRSLYSGRITKKHFGGKYDVTYDDGDMEQRVPADLIQAVSKSPSKVNKDSPILSSKNVEFSKGDKVKAKYKGGSKYFPGTITRCRESGTYDIKYDDGDIELRVEKDLIETVETEANKGVGTPKKPTKFDVGDPVKARYKGGKKLFAGKISKVNHDGTYDIKYDDGDTETRVSVEFIESVEDLTSDTSRSNTKSSPVKKRLGVGAKVRARYKGGNKFFKGEIILARTDGSFDIRYEDGDSEKHVEADMIELVDDGDAARYEVGQSVQAYYKGGQKLFRGKITRVHSNGTYDIKYSDGDSETRISASQIVVEKTEKSIVKGFAVGEKIKARYKGGSKLFSGKITRVHTNGTYDIKYDDGDSETRVDPANVVCTDSGDKLQEKESTESPRLYEVGDAVNARYKGGAKIFAAKISRVRSDGTYDLEYTDGDTETRVRSEFIEPAPATINKRSELNELAIGSKVRARYKKGSKWFPAKITRIRTDSTFDLLYDDGDEELRVEKEYIEPLAKAGNEKPIKNKSKDDEEDLFGDDEENQGLKKKSSATNFSKGDAIEADFKKKGKFHRGKIVKVHSDGTFDIEYDAGASEKRVERGYIRKSTGASDEEGTSASKSRTPDHPDSKDTSNKNESRGNEQKSTAPQKPYHSSEAVDSPRQCFQVGMRVTQQHGKDAKSKRIGTIKRMHRDGSCDVSYPDGNTTKRLDTSKLLLCSDSEDSGSEASSPKHNTQSSVSKFRRNENVLCSWRRPSKFARGRQTKSWKKAKIVAIHGDNTFTVQYEDGTMEEDVPAEAIKTHKKERGHSEGSSDISSSGESSQRPKTRQKRRRAPRIQAESFYLLKQLAQTLIEEGQMESPQRDNSCDGSDSSGSSSSSSLSSEGEAPSSEVYKVARKLLAKSVLSGYRSLFSKQDKKKSGKLSRSQIIELVQKVCNSAKEWESQFSKPKNTITTLEDANITNAAVSQCLSDWFESHDDLRTHKRFAFPTFLLAVAVAKHRLGKLRVERAVASALDGRFASQHEYRRQLQLWQQKLGFRVFETLQRLFHEQALSNIIPSRVRVASLQGIFDVAVRSAVPSKPLEVYLQQLGLYPHQTLLFPEFLCCYYQLYGSASDLTPSVATASSDLQTLELRPIAFVASCMFANGDAATRRHGDLVRRLCVGRTPSQQDLILRFREVFEALLNVSESSRDEPNLLPTSQLAAFASKVVADPTLLAPAIATLCKRSASVSLVEVFASCGFIIDELTTAPTLANAIEKMRLRTDIAEVRRIISLTRSLCLKILRFPNNSDYWRIRADTDSFQRKIGRYDGATSLLEAAGFVEYKCTHFELRGARAADGKRVTTLSRSTLDCLRESCVQLDAELALLDGVESVSSVIARIAEERAREGGHFALEECRGVLKHLVAYIETVLKNPKDSRCWRIRQANTTFEKQIGYLPFATDLMATIGYDLIETTQGYIFALRGTTSVDNHHRQLAATVVSPAPLSNFTFSSVSSQMEWFLWRRKQEIDNLLQGELQFYFGQTPSSDAVPQRAIKIARSPTRVSVEIAKMYPYGTNALDTFNRTGVQQKQLEMMRECFGSLDQNARGYLNERDFAQLFPQWVEGPPWLRFDAFDIGCDGNLDFADFVAALGPILDHTYDITQTPNDKLRVFTSGSPQLSLCEAVSSAVGRLRLSTSLGEATKALELVLIHLHRLLEEPSNDQFWRVEPRTLLGNYAQQLTSVREILRLAGFCSIDSNSSTKASDHETGDFQAVLELFPHRVTFSTSAHDQQPHRTPLDSGTLASMQTVTAMLAGHYRGLRFPSVSDVGAVSRAIGGEDPTRYPDRWIHLIELVYRCVTNVLDHPEQERYRQLRTSTETYKKIVASVPGGENIFMAVGFRKTITGVLALPFDEDMVNLKARHLELGVGVSLLREKPTASIRARPTTAVATGAEKRLAQTQTDRRPKSSGGSIRPNKPKRGGANA